MPERGPKGRGLAATLAYALVWLASLAYLATSEGDFMTAVFVMAIFGLALPAIAWALTRGVVASPISVRRPAVESGAVLIYLVVIYAVGFLGFGMSAARAALPAGQGQELLVMALKLAAHIALPALLLILLGARLGPLVQAGLSGRRFWRTLIVLGLVILGVLAVISPSLANIAATGASPALLAWAAPVSFVWIAVEAGLNEEFLFRGVLQTRLTAWFGSAWAGVMATSVIFALAHAPGLYLRAEPGDFGASTDPLHVAAYTIAVLSPVSLLFGLIYARTKSLLLVVLLHGLVDVLPSLAGFIEIWT